MNQKALDVMGCHGINESFQLIFDITIDIDTNVIDEELVSSSPSLQLYTISLFTFLFSSNYIHYLVQIFNIKLLAIRTKETQERYISSFNSLIADKVGFMQEVKRSANVHNIKTSL